eukprot:65660_1
MFRTNIYKCGWIGVICVAISTSATTNFSYCLTNDTVEGWYDGESIDIVNSLWKDKSASLNDATINNNAGLGLFDGTDETHELFTLWNKTAVYGTTTTQITFNVNLHPTDHTVFNYCKYRDIGTKNRILQTGAENGLFGFWMGRSGQAYEMDWITDGSTDYFGSEWVLSSQQNDLYRGNRVDLTTNPAPTTHLALINKLMINLGSLPDETSDFACTEIIIINQKLPLNEITCIEDYLFGKYNEPLPPSPPPTTSWPTMAPTYYTLPFIFGGIATVYEVSLSFGGNVVRTLSAGDVVEFIDPGGHYDVYVGLVQITLKFNYNVTSHICDSSCCNSYRRVLLSVDDMYGSAGCRRWCFTEYGRYCYDSRTALAQTLSVQYRSDGSSRNINMGIDSTSSRCDYYSMPILPHAIGLIVATQLPTVSPTAGSNGPTNIPSTAPITPSKSPSDAPSSSKAPSDEPTMAPSPSQPAAEKAPTVLNTGLLYSEVVLFLWVAGLTIVLCCVMCTVFYCWNQWRTKALAHSQDIEHMNENGANIAPEIPMIPNHNNDDDVLCVKQLEERVDSGLVEAEDVCDEGVDCNEFIEWMKDTVGLEEYTQMMMENGYGDVISLAFVTMDDLKEVGVTTIAHRRRIYFLAQQKCQQSVTNKNTNDHSQVETGGTRITGTGGAAV